MRQRRPAASCVKRQVPSDKPRLRRRARLPIIPALVLVAMLNAACYPLIAIGLGFAPLLFFATLRALIAGVALAVMAALLRRPVPRGGRTWLLLAGIGAASTSLGYLGMFHGAEFVSPGLATVIANSQPLVAAVLAQVFLHERLAPLRHLGLLVGFAGIVAVSMPRLIAGDSAGFAIGLAYIILAAAGVAAGNVLMKSVSGRIDPLVAMAAQLLFGAVPLGVAAVLREEPTAILWTPRFIASLLGLALPGTALSYWLWFMSLERIPLGRANAFTFLTPFFGLSLGIAVFGERPGGMAVVGLLLTVVGVALVERAGPDPSRSG